MAWGIEHTAGAVVSGMLAAVVPVAKAVAWWRERSARHESERVTKAVQDAERHAEERAYRERVLSDLAHVKVRVDESHDRLDAMGDALAETREHVAELRGLTKVSGLRALK